jgi:F-type H+-transporting ATPase subunit alpha
MMGRNQTTRVMLRSPVELDASVIDELRRRLAATLEATVVLKTRVEPDLRGAVLVLDERHQIRFDPAMPLSDLERQLSRARKSLDESVALEDVTRRTIQEFEPAASARLAATNLCTALSEFKGSRVTLVARTEIERAIVDQLAEKLCKAADRDIEVETRIDPRLEDGAVLMLGDDRRIVLDGRYQWLAQVERGAETLRADQTMEAPDPSELLRDMIERTAPELAVEELLDTGTVMEVGDGIARVSGLRGVGSQEIVEFESGLFGLAFSLNAHEVGCILLGSEERVHEGSGVRRTGHLLRVPVGEALLGRVVNSLGQPIDARGAIAADTYQPAERLAPGVVEREPVTTPLHTGLKVVDALVPLGRGQRELIIGDRKIGKTTIAVDTILAQRDTGVVCVYAAIGQKASSVASVVRVLEQHGALEYTVVVASLPGQQPAFRYLTPYAACAIGEFFMESGRDALVIYDDLSKHAVTYREMSALLERPIGREAYPGDIFYVHSRLLERAAHLSEEHGGGSLTALPIVETQAGDISAFIPTNVISICDGQIFLDAELFNEGFRPALDVGLSVSRVGGAAQTRPMKRVAGRLRIDLAQYHEMAQFVKFGAEVDVATQRQLARGERSRELLKQGAHAPLSTGLEVASLFAATEGQLDEVPVADIRDFESRLHERLSTTNPSLVERLGAAEELDQTTQDELTSEISRFAESYGHRAAATAAEEV